MNPAVGVVGLESFAPEPLFQANRVVVIHNHAEGMKGAEGRIIPAHAMPDADEEKNHQDGQGDGVIHVGRTGQPRQDAAERRKNHVAHVDRERDVPAVPEILHAAGRKGIGKILCHGNAHQPDDPDGDIAHAGEIAVEVQVIEDRRDGQVDPRMVVIVQQQVGVTQLGKDRPEEEKLNRPHQHPQRGARRRDGRRRRRETPAIVAVSIDRPHRHRRHEETKSKILPETGLLDRAVANFQHKMAAPEGQIGNAQEIRCNGKSRRGQQFTA